MLPSLYLVPQEDEDHLAKIKAVLKEDEPQKVINTTAELKKLQGANNSLENRLTITIPSFGVYDGSNAALRQSAATLESDLDTLATASIVAIGNMDCVLCPDQQCMIQFKLWLTCDSPERSQKYWGDILNMTPTDFKDYV